MNTLETRSGVKPPPLAAAKPARAWRNALHAAALASLVVLPFVLDAYYLSLALPFMAYAIVLLGFNFLFGYGGLLSFGGAFFVAVGAYAAAFFPHIFGGASLEGMIAFAVTVALVVAIPVALISCRFTGIFFGMLTLSFGMIFHSFLMKFYSLTGGETGLLVAQPTLFGVDYSHLGRLEFLAGPFYYYCAFLLAAAYLLMWRLICSPFGLHLMAARDNETKATYLGVRVYRVRAIAFVVAAVYGAVGGVVLAVNAGLADPELAYWTHSGELVFMTVLGGYQILIGPIIGALVFTLLQDQLQSVTQYWRLSMGVVLATLVIVAPGGIAGALKRWSSKRRSA